MCICPSACCPACRSSSPPPCRSAAMGGASSAAPMTAGRSRSRAIRCIRRAWGRPTCSQRRMSSRSTIRIAAQVTRRNGEITAFTNLQTVLLRPSAALAKRGRRSRLLTGPVTSPTILRQIAALRQSYPGLRWHTHDPLDDAMAREGARQAFGRELDALPRWSELDVVVTLGRGPVRARPAPDRQRPRSDGAPPGPRLAGPRWRGSMRSNRDRR